MLERNTSMVEAFRVADDVLRQGVQGISDLITLPGLINLDFADVRTIMRDAGPALLGIGMAGGENRGARRPPRGRLLAAARDHRSRARAACCSITGGADLSLFEVNEAAGVVSEAAHPDANIIFGAIVDEKLKDQVWVTVVATGFGDEVTHAQAPARGPEARTPAPRPEPREDRATPFGPAPRSAGKDFDIPSFVNQPDD